VGLKQPPLWFSCVVAEMHRSLLISEVVVKICQELAYPCHGILFFGSLAGFATTCRAISEPALDVLWHEQSSLAPLLRCMPSDLWEARVVANGQTCLVSHHGFVKFSRPLGRSEVIFIVSPPTNCLHRLEPVADLCASYQSLRGCQLLPKKRILFSRQC
jgi:hypothetical protein